MLPVQELEAQLDPNNQLSSWAALYACHANIRKAETRGSRDLGAPGSVGELISTTGVESDRERYLAPTVTATHVHASPHTFLQPTPTPSRCVLWLRCFKNGLTCFPRLVLASEEEQENLIFDMIETC